MSRAAQLFASSAALLLTGGLLHSRLFPFTILSLAVHIRGAAFAVPWDAVFFGLAAFFSLFACVYALWSRLNQSAAMWHFWLSAVAIALYAVGLVAFQVMKPALPASPGTLGTIVVGIVGGSAAFVAAQIVFLSNAVISVIRQF
jgi:hypothetical protein